MAIDYKTLVNNINNIYTDGSSAIEYINSQQLTIEEFGKVIDATDRFTTVRNAEGKILNISEKVTSQVATESIETALNSNLSTVTSTTSNIPLKVTTNAAGKVTLTQGLKTGLKFIGNTVLPAIAAASGGIMLGKAIDSTLYNLNPDFWDAHGMSTLNPETWRSITAGENGVSANLFNMVYGIDPETGTTQAYMDQEALAYITAYMIQQGVFAPTDDIATSETTGLSIKCGVTGSASESANINFNFNTNDAAVRVVPILETKTNILKFHFFSKTSTTVETSWNRVNPAGSGVDSTNVRTSLSYNGQSFYRGVYSTGITLGNLTGCIPTYNTVASLSSTLQAQIGYTVLYGTITEGGGIAGITNQDGATGFDASGISDPSNIASVLNALQSQYPGLFQNAITQPVGDPLQNPDRILIPVGTPQLNPQDQTQPIANIATQLNPELNPSLYPELDLQPWTDMILKPEYEPEPEPDPDPEPNPPDTGDGVTPPVVPPEGTAGALFTVYNPTQAQIDSFGGWLWSSNFVDQLLKVFTNPMEAIISLHKIFCTPSAGSSANIYVGYLDSGVSAAKVTSQYTTINCGSVSLPEYYGNALDYTDTKVELYLPFVGIVSLDIADIMRSTISVIYHVDVYTGACLADVSITRDSVGGVLYQYAGNCAVHYPLSSGSYMGIVSGLLGVAGTVATGGSVAPMLIGATGSVLSSHTSVQRSGGFSANAGAMGAKNPYLIISRPQTAYADNYKKYAGGSQNKYVTISSLSGFIRAKYVRLTNITGATGNELAMIEQELKNGVIV